MNLSALRLIGVAPRRVNAPAAASIPSSVARVSSCLSTLDASVDAALVTCRRNTAFDDALLRWPAPLEPARKFGVRSSARRVTPSSACAERGSTVRDSKYCSRNDHFMTQLKRVIDASFQVNDIEQHEQPRDHRHEQEREQHEQPGALRFDGLQVSERFSGLHVLHGRARGGRLAFRGRV